MNYKVLYRKYRPNSFDTLVGQKPIVEILKNSIKENKIAHAYIFSGPRGTGKTSTARILAKSINCLDNKDGLACNQCANCLAFDSSPDIIEIDAASNNGVNDIRELINNVKIMPTSLKYKIYIIDEVHMLSESAYNALLLTLEEPPEHVIFILATTNLESVPITILSRCQKFDFKRISEEDIINQLKYICQEEKIEYDDEAIKEIAILSEGGLRDALSILDQLSKNSTKITLDLVVNEIGTVSNKKIIDLIEYIDNKDIEKIENIISEFRNVNLNYKVVIKKIINTLSEKAIQCLKNGSNKNLDYDDYKNMIFELNDLINKININVDPYILIEILLMKYVDNSENEHQINENIPKLAKDTKNISREIFSPPVQNISKEEPKVIKKETNKAVLNQKVYARINNCFVKANKDALFKAKEQWKKFTEEASAQLKRLISDTAPVMSSDEYMVIETTIAHQDQELNEQLNFIEQNFNSANDSQIKLVFVDTPKWNEEKNKYINNLKSGYKYEYINEEITVTENKNSENEESTSSNIEDIANNIFDVNKIEIE